MKTEYQGIEFSDEDVVNPDWFISQGDFNPNNVRPWLIYNEYGTLAVVFASCEQDALDEAVDADKMDIHKIPDEDVQEAEDCDAVTYLGSASEPFNIDNVHCMAIPNPKFSLVALFKASQENGNV